MNDFSVIKKYRKNKKMTQVQVASKVGVSSAYIQQLENGIKTNPNAKIVTKIADLLKIPYNELPDEYNPDKFFDVEWLFSNIETLQEKEAEQKKKFNTYDIEDIFDETILKIMNSATDSEELEYSRKSFSSKEIYEISSFVFNSYLLKVDEILIRHKKDELLLNKGLKIAHSKLSKKDLSYIESLSSKEQNEILEKANEIASKILSIKNKKK